MICSQNLFPPVHSLLCNSPVHPWVAVSPKVFNNTVMRKMARVCSHQLLILLSFVSSFFYVLTRRANAQNRPTHIRSRLSQLLDAETALSSMLNSGESQSNIERTMTYLTKNCEDDCYVYGSFSDSYKAPKSIFKRGLSKNYHGRLQNNVYRKVIKDGKRNLEKDGHHQRGVMHTSWTRNADVFGFLMSRLFDSSPGKTGEAKRNDMKNFQWQLVYPFQRTLQKRLLRVYLQINLLKRNPFKSEILPLWQVRYSQEEIATEMWPAEQTDMDHGSDESREEITKQSVATIETQGSTPGQVNGVTKPPWTEFQNGIDDEQHSLSLNVFTKSTEEGQRNGGIQAKDEFSDVNSWSQTAINSQRIRADSTLMYQNIPTIQNFISGPQYTRENALTDTSVTKRRTGLSGKRVFVYGHDDRHRVLLPQMRKFPFSNIARLSTGCTGTLVTPRHVLTAAHCVHNGVVFRDNLEKLKIEIPDNMGFKDYYAQKITIPMGWLRENRSMVWSGQRAVYDYAVIHLTLAVAGRTRFLPLAVPRPGVLQMDFHFLAFPEDDQQLWGSVCLASQHMAIKAGNLIMTRCDAAVGNSGAAVFVQEPQGGLRVVGILSNTMHAGHHRSFFRYSIITALTWSKLNHICQELDNLGQQYNVCPPERYMRRSPSLHQIELEVIPFFGKRDDKRQDS